MRASKLLVLALVLFAGGCKPSQDLTGPSAPPSAGNVAVFLQVHTAPGPFTLTLAGQTISTVGDHRFDVPNGTHMVTGQLTLTGSSGSIANLSIRIHGLEGIDVGRLGGPERGTLQNFEGPLADLQPCDISYRVAQPSQVALRFGFNANRSVPIDRRC
jgi:hypothetical protein